MGLSTSATHIIFFIASVVIAASFVGIAASAVLNISNGIENRGNMIANQLSGEFKIINDPERMSNNPLILYLKNTGKVPLSTSHITILIDGTSEDNYTVNQDTWLPGETITLTVYVDLSSGNHVVKVVLENGLSDTFYFRV